MSEQGSDSLASGSGMMAEVERLRAQVAQLEERVAHLDRMAHEDVLVPLPNRRGFMRHLGRLIDRVRRYEDSAALLFVDIDGLKLINDSFGHQVGDEALIKVSELLQDGVRGSDCVARIGGDEFAVLLEHADEAAARETADRLADMVATCEFRRGGKALPLSIAIGVAVIDGDEDAEAVIARADAEMYEAKEAA
ncbi:GGDEF domain-containing protein [Sphingomonas piscis]|uniref:diguanylate cyclase n=1 Tax=Sphingomonas piscis TaxID=2714943 RepID=A0A6G7YQ36_9SPHN|nr:GGDEF domain-containing protein [Sphingomonas piscis]QIK78846.1 GGDEF domain-containing protein [Sphingomonas piscis]